MSKFDWMNDWNVVQAMKRGRNDALDGIIRNPFTNNGYLVPGFENLAYAYEDGWEETVYSRDNKYIVKCIQVE